MYLRVESICSQSCCITWWAFTSANAWDWSPKILFLIKLVWKPYIAIFVKHIWLIKETVRDWNLWFIDSDLKQPLNIPVCPASTKSLWTSRNYIFSLLKRMFYQLLSFYYNFYFGIRGERGKTMMQIIPLILVTDSQHHFISALLGCYLHGWW